MIDASREALLRTLSFHTTWGHAPTRAELVATLDTRGESIPREDVISTLDALIASHEIVERFGRVAFPEGADERIRTMRENEAWAPRKRRAAQGVARWLARLASVRFVALCNTTALGHARDEGDLDFFVVTRAGTIMKTRGLATLPFKLLGRRPTAGNERDAVCLSYFVTDDGLDLSSQMLKPDDPYFRYWFLSLVPLYDDGISSDLWAANIGITSRHPFARPWIAPPDFRVETPRVRIPVPYILEAQAQRLQSRAFPRQIRDIMNRDTRVMVNEKVLKFHVDDGREEYRKKYEDACQKRGICP